MRKTISAMALIAACMAVAASAAEVLPRPDPGGAPKSELYDYGVMGPPATPAIVATALSAVAKPIPPGPFEATWESIAAHYETPRWFDDAKFGIFIHWGLYSAAAYHNEWYETLEFTQGASGLKIGLPTGMISTDGAPHTFKIGIRP